MPKLIRKNLGWFLGGVLISLIVGFCFVNIFSTGAQARPSFPWENLGGQEQIKIFPTVFDGDWQNPEAVFSQDLDEMATFSGFNIVNSSYPLEISGLPVEEAATPPQEGIVFSGERSLELSNPLEIPEFPVEEAATPPQEGIVFLGERSLELSNFSVSDDFGETKIINNVQLRLSLAGKGEAGDKLIINYYYQDSWQNLAEFDLKEEISNALNGGYFLYALSVFESWADLENLKIRFAYQGQENAEVYLDSLWLEITTAEQPQETPEEQPQQMGERRHFKSNEEPEFIITKEGFRVGNLIKKIKSFFQPEFKIYQKTLIAPNGRTAAADLILEEAGEGFQLKIKKGRNFRPGKYFVNVEIGERGQIYKLEKEFTWGVLAINTNKSIYLPNEIAYIQMATLEDRGHAICDANLKLEIISPSGGQTSATVQKSGECGPNKITNAPDYSAYYQVDGSGTYHMKLVNLDNGYETEDSFEVKESVPFDIERIGPTRIYLFSMYEMKIIVKINQDFLGEIREFVPAFSEVTPHPPARVERLDDVKEISWQVDWKAGESHELRYSFYVPDISPYLYSLGPLEIADFKEMRFWQIAADAEIKIPIFASNSLHKCSIQPSSQTVRRGEGINYLISLTPSTQNTPFLLSLGNLPFGASATLSELSGIAPSEITLKFNTHPDAQVGSFSLTVIYQEEEDGTLLSNFCQLNLIIEE